MLIGGQSRRVTLVNGISVEGGLVDTFLGRDREETGLGEICGQDRAGGQTWALL